MSWWFDKKAVEQTLKLRDKFKINSYVETGVFRGLNVRFWSYYFNDVAGCDISDEYLDIARKKVADRSNVRLFKMLSHDFIELILEEYDVSGREDIILFYLDAHFYDPNLPKRDIWVVKKELQSLKGFKNCVLVIHDFDCGGLGHLCYDGVNLDYNLIKDDLRIINSNFYYYINAREYCDVHTKDSIAGIRGIFPDEETLETIDYHNTDRLKYRGILYCVPQKLDLNKFEVKEYGVS